MSGSSDFDTIDIEIVGTRESCRGRNCECHFCCGIEVLEEGVVVQFLKTMVQHSVGGEEEDVIAVHWVHNKLVLCRVGFLPKELVPRADMFHE
jgi:hypothetical protein